MSLARVCQCLVTLSITHHNLILPYWAFFKILRFNIFPMGTHNILMTITLNFLPTANIGAFAIFFRTLKYVQTKIERKKKTNQYPKTKPGSLEGGMPRVFYSNDDLQYSYKHSHVHAKWHFNPK